LNANVFSSPGSTSVVQAVGVNPGAIGYASVDYRTGCTRMLPLKNTIVDTAQPTEADASSRKYPLALAHQRLARLRGRFGIKFKCLI
jgi:ABC-type phosphate transport system substrate-binding protein